MEAVWTAYICWWYSSHHCHMVLRRPSYIFFRSCSLDIISIKCVPLQLLGQVGQVYFRLLYSATSAYEIYEFQGCILFSLWTTLDYFLSWNRVYIAGIYIEYPIKLLKGWHLFLWCAPIIPTKFIALTLFGRSFRDMQAEALNLSSKLNSLLIL